MWCVLEGVRCAALPWSVLHPTEPMVIAQA